MTAGGNWRIIVPPGGVQFQEEPAGGELFVGQRRTIGPFNLLALDRPTPMTEWDITSIRIPCLAHITTTAKPTGAVILKLILTLQIDGETVFQEEIERATEFQGGAEEKFGQLNVVFAADLVNPIVLLAGRSFTVSLAISSNVVLKGPNPVLLGIGERDVASATPGRLEGTIGYIVRALSGHRVLS